jgi:hypothetical protein
MWGLLVVVFGFFITTIYLFEDTTMNTMQFNEINNGHPAHNVTITSRMDHKPMNIVTSIDSEFDDLVK